MKLNDLRDLGAALGTHVDSSGDTIEPQKEERAKTSVQLWRECKAARDAGDKERESALWRTFVRVAEEEQRARGVIS